MLGGNGAKLMAFEATHAALLGAESDDLIDHIFRLSIHQGDTRENTRIGHRAIALGWLQDDGRSFTPEGRLVADSIREYAFWRERGYRLPLEGRVGFLSEDYYRDKSVLEIGCGCGCNLIPIRRTARRAVGVEPSPIYREMSAIFCKREGIDPLDVREGTGEKLPFDDGTFDIVLCVSTHQYTDILALIREASRVLRSGGELQIVGGTLGTYVRVGLEPMAKGSFRTAVSYVKTIANTLSYMGAGKRLTGHAEEPSTRHPIYPTRRRMRDWLQRSGLSEIRPPAVAWPETIFSFGKP